MDDEHESRATVYRSVQPRTGQRNRVQDRAEAGEHGKDRMPTSRTTGANRPVLPRYHSAIDPAAYHSAIEPSSWRQTGLCQFDPSAARSRTYASSSSIPSPGPSGMAT